jgi:hypothetical protein
MLVDVGLAELVDVEPVGVDVEPVGVDEVVGTLVVGVVWGEQLPERHWE